MAYEGYVDAVGPTHIAGWVYNDLSPNESVKVEILRGDQVVDTIDAVEPRDDLAASGKGNGRHAFTYHGDGNGELSVRVVGKIWRIPRGGLSPVGPHRFVRAMIHSFDYGWPPMTAAFTEARPDRVRPGVVERLMTAYHKAIKDDPNRPFDEADVWSQLSRLCHGDLLPLLKKRDVRGLTDYLADAHGRGITHGITQGHVTTPALRDRPEARTLETGRMVDYLVSLAEFLGVLGVESPEQHGRWADNVYEPIDRLIGRVSEAVGLDIVPPPVVGSLLGLKSGDGVLSGRDMQGLYAALRMKQLADPATSTVCEIGAGIGAAAYYAHRLGFKKYTIIDLPVVNLLHGFYLLRALPDADVRLYGEPPGGDVSIQPTWTFESAEPFDLLVNCDSFPEMNRRYSLGYLTTARRLIRRAFLSINQEAQAPQNPTETQPAVRELVKQAGGYRPVSRFRHWLRGDYVDEVFGVTPTSSVRT